MIKKFNNFLNEGIMNIIDLTDMVVRTGEEKETILAILVDEFKKGGDDAIIKAFKQMTKLDIEPIRKGMYVFK